MHPTNRRGPGQNPRHAHGQQTQPILIDDDDETYDIIRQPPRNHPPPRQQPITNFGYYDDGDQDMDDDEDEDEDEDDGGIDFDINNDPDVLLDPDNNVPYSHLSAHELVNFAPHHHPHQRAYPHAPQRPRPQSDYTYTYYTHTQSPSNQHNNKLRTRAREDRHAALCILLDRELLMLQALSHNETLPQARRRFLSKMMAPQDNTDTGVIRAERYTIHVPGSNSGGGAGQYVTVPRGVVDVCETGDEGWGSKEGRSQPASPAASPFGKGKSRTPTRPRASTPGSANRRRSGAR